jgi:hypothetical protein
MYRTYQDILQGLVDSAHAGDQDAYDNALSLMKLYESASAEARQYGYVGVGCISYADNALLLAQSKDFDESGNYGQNNPQVK